MNNKFHTPSLGDDMMDLADCEIISNSIDDNKNNRMPSPFAVTTSSQESQIPTIAQRKLESMEVPKPLSPYGNFFRTTVCKIRKQNANCSYEELSRIVANMWASLKDEEKMIYYNMSEASQVEYVKALNEKQKTIDKPTENIGMATKPAIFTINCDRSQSLDQNLTEKTQKSMVKKNETAIIPNRKKSIVMDKHESTSTATTSSLSSRTKNLTTTKTSEPTLTNNTANKNLTQTEERKSTNKPTSEQMLSEAGAVQKCTREECNKRAVINTDWEDEYCSNECVVVHCRNVFNSWVKANALEMKQAKLNKSN